MKKRIIAIALIALLALGLAGCAGNSTKISSEVAMANPWTDFDSLELAEEEVGFEITLPDMSAYGSEAYRVCKGLNELEVQYGEGTANIRKAKDDGDISGDYNEYSVTKTAAVGENTATLKGEAEDRIQLATWISGKYSYAVYIAAGVAEDAMRKLIGGVQ